MHAVRPYPRPEARHAARGPAAPLGLSWPLLVALGAVALTLATGPTMLGDSDVLWHVALGRWFIANRAVPAGDILSHSMAGAPWVAYEWLAEVLMAAAYDAFGWTGIVLLCGLAAALALALLARALLADLEPVHALLATVLSWALLMPHWLARPHMLALPLLVLWTIVLLRARARGTAPPLSAALLIVPWANLHGSFVIALALGAMLAAEAVWEAGPGTRARTARGWATMLGLAGVATLLTPNGFATWWLPFHLLEQHVALALLLEWRSPDFQQLQPLEIWLLVLLFLGFTRGLRLPLPRLLMLLLLIHLALKHARHADVLALVAPLLLAPVLGPQLRGGAGAARLDRALAALARPAHHAGLAIAVAATLAAATLAAQRPPQPPDFVMPEAAVQAARRAGVAQATGGGPVLNDYGFGGYLAFVAIPVFIDGRVDMYGDAFVARATQAVQGSADLPALLDQYRIAWTLLPPAAPAVALLDRLPGWRRLHADPVAVVHVRTRD